MILYNSIMCPDGTVLVSKHQHDYREHTQEDGRTYFVDGGLVYQRIGYSDKDFIDLSVYSDDNHEKIRNAFEWTRCFDKDMKKLPNPEVIKLKDIDDDHLLALVELTESVNPEEINKVFKDEVEYRKLKHK